MTILRPAEPLTETVVELWQSGETLALRLKEFRDEFRLQAKALRYQWWPAGWYWRRAISPQNGPLEDRLIEAAYKLLQAGFIVSVPATVPVGKVLAGEYADEHTRWIYKRSKGLYTGWFAITWAYGDSHYDQAKKITGARFSKPSVVVPPDQFDQVEDFANQHDFRFTPAAQEVLEQARQRRLQMIRVELRPRAVAIAAALTTEFAGEVALEFRDED